MMNLNILFRLNRLERWFKELYCEFKSTNPNGESGGGSSEIPNLQQVTGQGNTTSNDIVTTGSLFTTRLILSDISEDYTLSIDPSSITSNQTLNAPNKSGTIALLEDLRGSRLIVTDEEEYYLPNEVVTTIFTFNGVSGTLNLPPVSETVKLIMIITNAGVGDLTITSPDGVWEGGMDMPLTRMDTGSTARIVNDGIAYRINS